MAAAVWRQSSTISTHTSDVIEVATSPLCVAAVAAAATNATTATATNAAAAVVAVRRTVQYRRSKGLSFLNSHSSRA